MNILYFRFANSFLEPIWNRNYVASVQITLSENFGVGGPRLVLRNRRLSARRDPEPPLPGRRSACHGAAGRPGLWGRARRESQGLSSHAPSEARRLGARPVRWLPAGAERGEGLRRRDFLRLRLFIDSWRWEGVPWYLRSGKYLAETATEVLVELKPPPQGLFADSAPPTGRANYLRFRLSPSSAIALAARVKRAGKEFVGDQRELYWSKNSRERNRPTSGSWATPWPATALSSPVRTRSRPPGRWSSRSSRPTTGPAPTSAAVGGRKRLTT